MDIQLSVQQLTKRYKTGEGVTGISLDVRKGELITLLGPSGCGKTTVLRSIGGFLDPDSGDILIEGKVYFKHLLRNVRHPWFFRVTIYGHI